MNTFIRDNILQTDKI